ncbi:hypothetical protein CAC42_3993 [Sphaceloma murrayae]|uniref:Uncharacterized protein n=1 Tax=Sphaceloma murrayae TaxID=2082308 RepID=A0A2K1QSH6_9PEZI|nr:hypothetical protein CAC42_3993 [Sphaceloma murrayae]
MTDQPQLAIQTLNLLEERLSKLQLIVHGDGPEEDARDTSSAYPITVRLQSVERALSKLESTSSSIAQLLRLHKNQRTDLDISRKHGHEAQPKSVAATVVLAHASQLTSTTSQLRSIQDAPVPDSIGSVHVVAQVPRMIQAQDRAESQRQQMNELRARSAEIVARWHRIGVLGVGEVISEWDERLTDAERDIRQAAARRRREAGII